MEITIKGQPVQGATMVSVDTLPVKAQRPVRPTNVDNYIKEVGEFDWNLFGVVLNVQYPNGQQRNVDGGHRLDMVKIYLPDVTEVPAIILPIEDEEEASTLFHRLNGTCSKSVNNEEKFVAQVLGKEAGALKLEKGLKQCKAKVTSADNVVGDPKGKTIKIAKWKIFWKNDREATKNACEIINDVFHRDGHYNVMLLEGVIKLIQITNSFQLDWSKYENLFVDFLHTKSQTVEQNKLTYNHIRKDNHYGISVAYGLYCDWYDWCKINNKRAPYAKRNIAELYNKAGLQD